MRLLGSSSASSPLSSCTASSGMACIWTPGAWGNMRKFSNKRCLKDKGLILNAVKTVGWCHITPYVTCTLCEWMAAFLDSLYFLQVVIGVLVGHVGGADVQLEVWSKVLEVVIVRELWVTTLEDQCLFIPVLYQSHFYQLWNRLPYVYAFLKLHHTLIKTI